MADSLHFCRLKSPRHPEFIRRVFTKSTLVNDLISTQTVIICTSTNANCEVQEYNISIVKVVEQTSKNTKM